MICPGTSESWTTICHRRQLLNTHLEGLTLVSSAGHQDIPATDLGISALLTELAKGLLACTGPAAVVANGLRIPEQGLDDLTTPRPGPATALVSRPGSDARILHHRIVDVAIPDRQIGGATADLVGVLRLNPEQIPAAAEAITVVAQEASSDEQGSALNLIVFAVTRAGIQVATDDVRGWPTGADAPTEVTEAEAGRIKLARANRADDGVYSLLVLRRLSKPITALAAARGWTPNSITIASFFVGILAAGLFATGQRWGMVLGAVLLQASLVIDCSDGEVARLTGQYSTIGAWLDASTDRVKEYLAYAGLAVGAASNGEDVWFWAALTMILQTIRHLGDYTFNRVQVQIETAAAITTMREQPGRDPGYGSILAASSALNRPWVERVKKIIHLPIGERWLIISLTAAFLTPQWTFGVLIAFGLVALAYTTAGRLLRCRSWPATAVSAAIVEPQLDLGPLASSIPAIRSLSIRLAEGRHGWMWPSLTTAVELGAWLTVAAVIIPGWLPAAFAVIFTIAFHRYDILYRAMAGRTIPRWLNAAAAGVDGRLLYLALITALSVVAIAILTSGYVLAAVWLGIVAGVVASAQWIWVNREQ